MVQTRKRTLSERESQSEENEDNVSVTKTPRKTSSVHHTGSPRPNKTPRRSYRSGEKEDVDRSEPAVSRQSATPRRSSRRLSQSLETISEDSPLRNVSQTDTPTRRKGRGSLGMDRPEAKQTSNIGDSSERIEDLLNKVTPQKKINSGSGCTESLGACLKEGTENEKSKRDEKRKSVITLDTVEEGEENDTEADVEEEESEVPAQTEVEMDHIDISKVKSGVCSISSEGANNKLVSPERVSNLCAGESEESKDCGGTGSKEVIEYTKDQSESLSSKENIECSEKQVEVIENEADNSVKSELSSYASVLEKNKSDEESSSTEVTEKMVESDGSPAVKETVETAQQEMRAEQSVGFDSEECDGLDPEQCDGLDPKQYDGLDPKQCDSLDPRQCDVTTHPDQIEMEQSSESEVMEVDAVTGEEKENVSLETGKPEKKVVSEGKDVNSNFKSDALVEKRGMQNDSSGKVNLSDLNEQTETLESVKVTPRSVVDQAPRGQPKSGRWWKNEKKRFSSVIKVKPLKTSWAKKMQKKEERQAVLAASAAVKEEKRQKMEELRERQRINKERREENARKAEVVQLIKDPRKLKRMKRKQLRQIETRDPSRIGKLE